MADGNMSVRRGKGGVVFVWIAAVVAAGLLGFLVVAMLRPEWFE